MARSLEVYRGTGQIRLDFFSEKGRVFTVTSGQTQPKFLLPSHVFGHALWLRCLCLVFCFGMSHERVKDVYASLTIMHCVSLLVHHVCRALPLRLFSCTLSTTYLVCPSDMSLWCPTGISLRRAMSVVRYLRWSCPEN